MFFRTTHVVVSMSTQHVDSALTQQAGIRVTVCCFFCQASGSGGARLRPRSLWSTAQVARCQSYSSRATRSGLRLVRCGWYNDVDINLLRVHPSLPPTQCHVVWPTLHAWYLPTHAWYSPCSMLSHPTQSRTDGCAVCHWQRIDCATMSHLPRLLQPKAGRVGPVAVPMLPVGQEPGGR